MNRRMSVFSITLALGVLFGAGLIANAQATRTWVSGVGDDANPCSRTAPCKTFAGAISKTATGGEIDVLDPGGFGALTITKSISIEADGLIAGVLVSGTNGFVISAPGANVTIRGLTFEGLGTGLSGITVLTANSVSIENCFINNFTVAGISDTTATAGNELHVKNTIIHNCGVVATSAGQGILINPTAAASVHLDHVTLENNVAGLKAQGTSTTTVVDSIAAGNVFAGFSGAASSAVLNLEHVVSSSNGTGVVCNTGTTVRIGNSHIFGNTTTLAGSGTCSTFKNNDIDTVVTMTPISQQ
ncbi:MAG: right-handed parallel beta-helix repeat-containing protein [Blastocatellia bacterium]